MFRILIIYSIQPVTKHGFQYNILLPPFYRPDLDSEYVFLHYHIENISKSVIFRELCAYDIPSPIKVQRIYVHIELIPEGGSRRLQPGVGTQQQHPMALPNHPIDGWCGG